MRKFIVLAVLVVAAPIGFAAVRFSEAPSSPCACCLDCGCAECLCEAAGCCGAGNGDCCASGDCCAAGSCCDVSG